MFRKQAILVAVIGLALGATLLAVNSRGSSAAGEPQIDLDMDITNGTGPCNIIDTTRSAAAASTFGVAVCLTTNPQAVPVAAFGYKILYNDQIIIAAEVADVGSALDDNPDANAGTTTFGAVNLGSGWDCTGGVGAFPKGDSDGAINGTGIAYSGGCGSAAGPNTLLTGVLGVVNFTVTTVAPATLTLSNVSVTDNDLIEIGSCDPSVDVPAICNGGTVNNAGVPTATNTSVPPTSTPTPTNTAVPPTATNTSVPPTATNTPEVPVDTATPTNTPEVPVDTATPTNTPEVPVDTATPTNTPEVPVDTATPTNTPEVPVDTETPTNTPEVPVDTATPTNTPEVPVDTATPTDTPEVPVDTATATSTPPATNTPAITPTQAPATKTPAPQQCLSAGDKLHLLVGILSHFGAREGSRHYSSKYDVNHDGVINGKDFKQVLDTPTCRKHHHHHFHWWW